MASAQVENQKVGFALNLFINRAFDDSVAVLVALVEPAILEHRDPPAKRLLELNHSRQLLIESLSLLDTVDIGPQRFGQIDCGEHLHGGTFDASIVSPQILISLVIFVTSHSKKGHQRGRTI